MRLSWDKVVFLPVESPSFTKEHGKTNSLHVNSYVEKGKRIMGQSSIHKGSFFQAVNSAGREETNIPCGCAIKV